MDFEKKTKTTALAVTILVHVGVLIFCLLSAFVTPLPLPGEEGVEVRFGYSDAGAANDYFVNPAPAQPDEEVSKDDNKLITSQSEDEPYIPEEKDDDKDKKENEKQEIPEVGKPEPVVNPNALYKGSKSNSNNSGNSGTSGQSGTGGSEYGNPDSDNLNGLGGSGNGTSFSLEGRSPIGGIPKPEYTSQEQGTIVVEIIVDKKGKVVEATAGVRGTTITDQNLWKKAYEAAMRTKFSAKPDASERQKGTITYNFRRVNE
ncbi:MAG: hypothetical protein J6W04_03885 [Bacteroidales bacterium]|jgi:TonB family protein|nr:hypothetical protein [Bacteroidales bacterium]MBR5720233.1 hypothetical protein [Bacteroidales bacterium]